MRVFHSAEALFRAEMAALTHISWILLPLVLLAGVYALRQFLAKSPRPTGRYVHATLVSLVWLVYIGAWYYRQRHPAWTLGGFSPLALDVAGLSLVAGSVLGLTLRHSRPQRSRTPQVIALHLMTALITTIFLAIGLWPYR